MFGWLRRRRWRKLAAQPLPPAWMGHLERHVPLFFRLDEADQEAFLDRLKGFVGTKRFFGAKGFAITDEVRVVVAASAVRLIVHLDLSYYDRLRELVVYPYDFVNPRDADAIHLGEAHRFGTVVLSWPAVLRGLANPEDGHDTAVHEFAHALDLRDGAFDGAPPLRAREDYRCWAQVLSAHFERLRGGDPDALAVLRPYGSKDPAEFFAVATESFFERPAAMREHAPDLYGVLRRFYGYDPPAP